MLYHIRLIPIDISNLVISLVYIQAHINLKKIDLMSFLEIYKKNIIREKGSHNELQNPSKITLSNITKTPRFLNSTRILALTPKDPTCKPRITPRNT